MWFSQHCESHTCDPDQCCSCEDDSEGILLPDVTANAKACFQGNHLDVPRLVFICTFEKIL